MDKKQMQGHRKRLRERYLKVGYKGFEDYEILELLLTYSIKVKDCKKIAKDILQRFKKLEKVFTIPTTQLIEIEGVGIETALYLKLIGDILKNISFKNLKDVDVTTLKGKSDLIEYLKNDMGELKSEEFKVIYLNSNNNIVAEEILFKGTIDRSVIYPRKIIERAIENRARALVFVHNHPSGNLKPSRKDIEITIEMQDILKKMDIELIDHIIVSEFDYYSFYENEIIE